jgi:hypothetical protein
VTTLALSQPSEELLILVREGFGIIEQYSRLGCFGLVKRKLIVLLFIVEVDFTVKRGDLRGIFRIQWFRLLDNGDVVTGRGHLFSSPSLRLVVTGLTSSQARASMIQLR